MTKCTSTLLLAAAAGLAGCGDGLFTAPVLGSDPASRSETGAVEAPLCNGLPATIWVGMDPTLLPEGASIVEREHEDHDDPTLSSPADGTHDDGCSCGDDGETHARFEITGTRDDDVIVGSTSPDLILGLGGDDVICARQASDEVRGGPGEDAIFAGPGADRVHGDGGDDILHGGPGRDRVWGGPGDDEIFGGAGRDDLFGDDGDDILLGGEGPDTLDGGSGTNYLDPGPQECSGDDGHDGGSGGCGGHDDGSGGCTDGHDDGGGCTDEGGCTGH